MIEEQKVFMQSIMNHVINKMKEGMYWKQKKEKKKGLKSKSNMRP